MQAKINFGKNSLGFVDFRQGHLQLVPGRIEFTGYTVSHRALLVRVIPSLIFILVTLALFFTVAHFLIIPSNAYNEMTKEIDKWFSQGLPNDTEVLFHNLVAIALRISVLVLLPFFVCAIVGFFTKRLVKLSLSQRVTSQISLDDMTSLRSVGGTLSIETNTIGQKHSIPFAFVENSLANVLSLLFHVTPNRELLASSTGAKLPSSSGCPPSLELNCFNTLFRFTAKDVISFQEPSMFQQLPPALQSTWISLVFVYLTTNYFSQQAVMKEAADRTITYLMPAQLDRQFRFQYYGMYSPEDTPESLHQRLLELGVHEGEQNIKVIDPFPKLSLYFDVSSRLAQEPQIQIGVEPVALTHYGPTFIGNLIADFINPILNLVPVGVYDGKIVKQIRYADGTVALYEVEIWEKMCREKVIGQK